MQRKGKQALRKCNNIVEFAKVSTDFEWFYNKKSEIGIVRCKACFHLFLLGKPRLASMTPFEVYHFVNSNSFSSGMFYTKEKSRNMLSGGNNTWYHAKSLMIDHICLIGKGSVKHQETQPIYEKLQIQQKKKRNVFCAAITTLKLGSAGTHFETLLSMLNCCGAHIGNIGHSRINFNHILHCLEKSINKHANSWLETPLLSTGLSPHFSGTVDKATPSRTTNHSVVLVAHDSVGNICPIPVTAPEIYTKCEAATYDELSSQMVEAIKENFLPEIFSRYPFKIML